jgi:hypothetical protein
LVSIKDNERRHSSLQYYRGNPSELLSVREGKIDRARMLRKERNTMKGGEAAGTVS